ncbi:MAG: transposase [Actinomycetota bacterium]|nr:transposase [Actinomycetota bacterium]
MALFVWREGESLPPVSADDETATLDLLVTERDDLVSEATRLCNHLHQFLLQLDPGYRERIPSLTSKRGVLAALSYESDDPRPLQQERGGAVRRLARRLWLVVEQEREIAHRIERSATARFAPLTEICGISLLTAGALAGIPGPGLRFSSDAQIAAYAGVAPLEASSAERVRHRLARGGNRRLNAILYRIAITQARCSPETRAYLARRVAEGKTKREALQQLREQLSRASGARHQ